VSCTNELDEIECETAQPVLVGHIQVAYLVSHDSFQNLVKPSTLEVETASNVSDDNTVGSELFDETLRLVAEKPSLASR
jgi:hypothetical protein